MRLPLHVGLLQVERLVFRTLLFSLFLTPLLFPCAIQAQEKTSDSIHGAGWVVIPINEYKVLRAKAYPVEHDPEPPPLDATLTRVDYNLTVTGEVAEGRAELTVDVLKDGWARVPVPAGLLVREARTDGKLVSLVQGPPERGPGHLSALLSHSGRWVLDLVVEVAVSASAGDETFSLPSTDSGVTRASVQLPRGKIDLKIGGGLISEKSESASETKWTAYGRGNEPLTFTWRKKTEDHHTELPLRMRGSLTQLTSLAEDSSSIYAEANVDVVQGAARNVHLQLPQGLTINQVSGAIVADWEMRNGELVVTFLEPVEHSARFVIAGEARLPRDGIVDVPLMRLLNVEKDTGGVAVEILGAGEIKDQKAQGLEEADATDLGEMVASRQSPALIAFRARSGEAGATRSLEVNVARYDQQAVLMANIEEARYQILMSADGKELVQARYAVRNNQRNFVKLSLPAGATVWSASLGGKPVRPGQSPDGNLLLPLEKSRGGDEPPAFEVEILYLTKAAAWSDKGRQQITLPALDLPISRTGLLLYYPPTFRITPEQGTFRAQQYQSPISTALASNGRVDLPPPATAPPVNSPQSEADKERHRDEKKDVMQALLDSFKAKSVGGRVTGIVPMNVNFPAFGPSIFLVSELTSENQSPAAQLDFQRDKKAGSR
jgi:hypothetical protein